MLKSIYKKKEDIPEEYAGLFTEKKGQDGESQWELTEIEGVKTQGDVDRLRAVNQKQKEENSETKKELTTAKTDLNLATDKIAGLESEQGNQDDNIAKAKELVSDNARLTRENEAIQASLEKEKEQHTALESSVTLGKVKDGLRKNIVGLVRDEAQEKTISEVADQFEFVGGELLTKSDLGNKAGLEPKAYFEQHVEEYPYLAPPSIPGGVKGSKTNQQQQQTISNSDDQPQEFVDMIPSRVK